MCEEILATADDGEVRYMWQMQRDGGEWFNLPTCVGRALDREYSRHVTLSGAAKPAVASFVIHLTFGKEMKWVWMAEHSSLNQDKWDVYIRHTFIFIYI